MLRKIKDMDKVLLFSSLLLFIYGALNIVTASSREAIIKDAGLFYFFNKHLMILIAGLVIFLIVISIPIKKYKKYIPILYIIVIILNAYLILKGVTTRGANNWINLGVVKIQPSEFAKPMMIIMLALLFEFNKKKLENNTIRHDSIIWMIMGVGLIPAIFVFLQKDLGTAIILLFIFAILFIFSPISKKEKIRSSLITLGILAIALIIMLSIKGYVLSDTQESRLNNFFDPCSKYETTGYQVCNAFIAINNGGLTGVGLGKSTQKYSYIPEPHTDMVFAIIAEEGGLITCTVIFILYCIILYRIIKLSVLTKKTSNKYICIGAATYIFMHIFVNLGGLFGIIPLTGVPLPFLSYGGSFTLSLIIMLAVLQRIHIEYKNEKIKIK